MELFDSHAHYDDEKFNEDRDFIINEIYKSGVTKFVSAGYSLESSKIGIELAKKYDFIYTTSGISPNDIPATKYPKFIIICNGLDVNPVILDHNLINAFSV